MPTKTALITGTSRPAGIGFAVARRLAEQGHHVILTARDVSRAEPLAAELRDAGHQATALRLDLTDPAGMAQAAAHLTRSFGHLDVLINNASDVVDFTALSALAADINAVRSALDIDVLGPWQLVQTLLPLLEAAPAARIVNVSSVSALQIATGLDLRASLRAPAHSFAKHVLNVLTEVLAHALKDTPILVNSVDPGETATHPERGDEDSARPAADSARGIVWAATLPHNGPTGGFFRDGESLL
ncbi:SDR family NAD(P)-dependent oxidoreductase [Amycolatopsis saalfeldensis]|uniref:NADP-dependent 3-hydroxy acid dehydrogenase YdfG n=1 Tax=Amycolatopsis saalfeldensis TaxID=394193 RepID=A0A1H8Y250_9PSEU|nr:SDR family NAD(P)-dependent oxidoreductase [Amycolatopsis saalfeldensis]SEP46132.1 NADP-dependent 3-hydroxy acid dehydrogenase YdfG [Amycolatopsis saalfeldensis]